MKSIITTFLLISTLGCRAQTEFEQDVKSPEAIIAALYDVISGTPEEERNWARFQNLFSADARLIPTYKNKEGKTGYKMMTPEEYQAMFTVNIKKGFFEKEISRTSEEFGNIVHVFSSYETRELKDGPVTMRGINSIQLLKTEDRYYIMNIFWSAETKEMQLPKKYVK
jgi:hypothetical protein